MKAKREQVKGDLMVIKLSASNYARDLMIIIFKILLIIDDIHCLDVYIEYALKYRDCALLLLI